MHEDNSKSGANKTPFIYSLRQTKGGSRKFGGWSNAGMRRYRELVHMVRAEKTMQTIDGRVCERERGSIEFKRKRNSDDGVRDPVVEVPNDLDLMEEV